MLLAFFQGFDTPMTLHNYLLILGGSALWALPCSFGLAWMGRLFFQQVGRIPGRLMAAPLVSLLVALAVLFCLFAPDGGGALGGVLVFLVPLLVVLGFFGVAPGAILIPPVVIGLGLGVAWVFYLPYDGMTGAGGPGFVAFILMLVQWWRLFYHR
ncbi:hypothetical protein [Hymenobacter glacialis]|uniref:Uncharacterized protein n=1 Tax=Hymenobacter glacialis TaxID=1908236 RepID=A0A1G1SX50_9BACT|nr:hypothetical protein [Hymenobacter glacialis]OGX83201.1 hypothetical protein BEN48_17280 [Hymenobacter glacialis]